MARRRTEAVTNLGPNLQIEFFKDEIPDIGVVGDLHDTDGLPVFGRSSDKRGNRFFETQHLLQLAFSEPEQGVRGGGGKQVALFVRLLRRG